jgi:hypothetical protein
MKRIFGFEALECLIDLVLACRCVPDQIAFLLRAGDQRIAIERLRARDAGFTDCPSRRGGGLHSQAMSGARERYDRHVKSPRSV